MTNQSQWARRLSRVRSMRGEELLDRVRQSVTARVDAWRYQRGHDFSSPYSAPSAPHGRFFFGPPDVPGLAGLLNQRFPSMARDIVARAEKILQHRFDLLGFDNLDYGSEIDWHLDLVHNRRGPRNPWFRVNYLDFDEVGDSKITWELNRHQHFVTLAKAYRLTADDRFVTELLAQWKSWHAANAYPIGMNWASSLEVAFRTVSWVWVYFLMLDTPAMTSDVRREFVQKLGVSGRHIETFLSTYFSPNTHLLGEAVALFFLGTLFPDLPRATSWKERGWAIVQESATRQVWADGFYFEQSTYYHVYALDMFLHTRVLAALNGHEISASFDHTLTKMLDTLLLLGRAGVPPLFGDDDGGRWFDGLRNRPEHLLDPLCTGAILFSRGDFKFFVGGMREETLWLLGAAGLADFETLKSHEPTTESIALRESGLYLMADDQTGQQLVIDAGPHGPGHGHADSLSLQLVRGGRVLLRDSGTLEYVGATGERAQYRGTGAHNTMRVDGLDQAEGLAPFSWAKPPAVKVDQWVAGRSFNFFAGSHDGYTRLPEPLTHQRSVFQRKGQFWMVRDRAHGVGQHHLEVSWHLGPTLSPISTKDNLFADGSESLGLVTPEGHGWAQSAHRGDWSPVYGRQERSIVLTFASDVTLPSELVTVLLPDATVHGGTGRLERMASREPVTAYRFLREGEEHHLFFSDGDGAWTQGNWTSDAKFLYWASDRARDLRVLVMCGGTYADVRGARLLSGNRLLDYAEVLSSAEGTEVFSSHPDQAILQGSLDRVEMEFAVPANGQRTDQ